MGVDLRGSSPRTPQVTRTLFMAAIRDAIRGVFGRAPVTIPMVGEPGAVAVFTGTEDNTVARALAAEAPEWRNEMAARSLFSLIRYRPGKLAGRLVMPLLICVADDDTAASVPLAVRAAEQAPRGDWDSDVVQAINNESGADNRSLDVVLARLLAAYLGMPRHVSAMITISRELDKTWPSHEAEHQAETHGARRVAGAGVNAVVDQWPSRSSSR